MASLARWLESHRHWCMSLIRIYLGVGLLAKAITFIAERDELVRLMVENDVLLAGSGLAHIVILTHVAGGTMMAVGFATRVAAAIQVPNLVGAVFFVHWSGGVFGFAEELRFTALVLFLLLIFIWYGSGPLSLDASLRRGRSAPEAPVAA